MAAPTPAAPELEVILDDVGSAALKLRSRDFEGSAPFQQAISLDRANARLLVFAIFDRFPRIADRLHATSKEIAARNGDPHWADHGVWWNADSGNGDWVGWCRLAQRLLLKDHKFSSAEWTRILTRIGTFRYVMLGHRNAYFNTLLSRLEKDWPRLNKTSDLIVALNRVKEAVSTCAGNAPQIKAARRMDFLLDQAGPAPIETLADSPAPSAAPNGPTYNLSDFESARPAEPGDAPPPFPTHPNDPLSPKYELIRRVVLAAAAHIHPGRDNAADYPPGVALLEHTSKHDAFVATVRWCIWMHYILRRLDYANWPAWRAGMHCVYRMLSTTAAGAAHLSDSEVAEFMGFWNVPHGDRTGGIFPGEAIDNGLRRAMQTRSKQASTGAVAAQSVFNALIAESVNVDPGIHQPFLTSARLLVYGLNPEGQRQLLTMARQRALALWADSSHTWDATDRRAEYKELSQLLHLVEDHLGSTPGWTVADIEAWIPWCASPMNRWRREALKRALLLCIEALGSESVSPPIAAWLEAFISDSDDRTAIERAKLMLGDSTPLILEAGEAWSDQARADTLDTSGAVHPDWKSLLCHAQTASSAAPSAKWLKTAATLIAPIGTNTLRAKLISWFPLVDKPRTIDRVRRNDYEAEYTNLLLDPHMDLLKGLCWIAATIPNPDLARALGRLAISCYRKVPGIGPRATKVGNAAVHALGQMPGMDSLGQLAMLRVKVKFGTAQKGIEKALNAAAARESLPREEIEELGIPTYGLTEVGKRTETLGDFEAELTVSGIGDTELLFYKLADAKRGKAIKSIPAALKASHPDEHKDLKAAMKDIAAMLPAQKDRIDAMFLDNKSWPLATWQDRYLNHPLVGILARRLIWTILGGLPLRGGVSSSPTSFTFLNGTLVSHTGSPISLPDSATIKLWHPLDSSQEEVLAWRRFFEDRQIKQPFKQAHREVYLLTDAERRTATYSNRFAAHIIKQHQFAALAAARNWKNKLRLMVDDEYPPATRKLPAHNLRAEFWVEGAGDEHGTHTNDAGVYNHLTTDQVRFYSIDAIQVSAHAGGGGYGTGWRQRDAEHGLALDTIPPLVLSEILRDCDLFVGVCSVANNPQWNDGGPGAAHRDYWWTTSFGDLSQTGAGRKDLLTRLLPKLTIAPVASLSGNYLTVRGKLRTYKIHLGSGNILMEPNDQYLCIVPSGRSESAEVFLPFEGDRILAIILSKAFMLAEDDKIKDASITSQITHK